MTTPPRKPPAMKTHYLEFIALEPQPVGPTTWHKVAQSSLTDGKRLWKIPDGWNVLEATTQTLFGRECWVRMADHLVEGKGAGA